MRYIDRMRSNLSGLLAWNFVLQAGTQGVALVTGVVTALVLSRHLGVDGFGGFNYLFAFIYFFLALNDLGINTIVVREISQAPVRAAEVIGGMLSFRLLLGVAMLVLAWGTIAWMTFPASLAWPLAVFSLLVPLNALRLPSTIFQSELKFEYGAVVEIASRVTNLALILAVVWAGGRLFGVASALVAGELVGIALTWWLAGRLVRPVWRVDLRLWSSVLRSSLPLGLAGVLVAAVNRVDFLMLERMSGLGQVGLYSAAYKVTNLIERVPQMMMIALYPLMARASAAGVEPLRRLYRTSALGLGALALPVVAGVTWAGPVLLRIMFGADFVAADPGLRVLVWSTACIFAAMSAGFVLITVGWERANLVMWMVATAVNVTLNLLWIPRFGFVGAAWATVWAYIVVLATQLTAVEVYFHRARRLARSAESEVTLERRALEELSVSEIGSKD